MLAAAGGTTRGGAAGGAALVRGVVAGARFAAGAGVRAAAVCVGSGRAGGVRTAGVTSRPGVLAMRGGAPATADLEVPGVARAGVPLLLSVRGGFKGVRWMLRVEVTGDGWAGVATGVRGLLPCGVVRSAPPVVVGERWRSSWLEFHVLRVEFVEFAEFAEVAGVRDEP